MRQPRLSNWFSPTLYSGFGNRLGSSIVDEAHHLEWTPKEASTAYQMVEGLAQKIPSVLLLTATPQQLGPEGHFARLRLLDPIRYNDLESFVRESDDYQRLAELVERIDGNQDLSATDWEMIQTSAPHLHDQYSDKPKLTSADREQLSESMLDSFGPGRVMFRNTRNALKGIPQAQTRSPSARFTWRRLFNFRTKD